MNEAVFQQFREMIYKQSGIALGQDKLALLTARISKRLRALELSTEREYLDFLRSESAGDELVNLLDVVSTNTTYFFREEEHFHFLGPELKRLQNQGQREIKLWCAAASSGEEPYTLAMTGRENLDPMKCKLKMLATDISMTVLKKAQRGWYHAQQLDKLPKSWKEKYFTTEEDDRGTWSVVDEQLKNDILFKRLNLSEFPYPLRGSMDFIFCRNVMIYFDNVMRGKVVAEFEKLLKPGGYLVISKTESLISIPHGLQGKGNSIYQKVG